MTKWYCEAYYDYNSFCIPDVTSRARLSNLGMWPWPKIDWVN